MDLSSIMNASTASAHNGNSNNRVIDQSILLQAIDSATHDRLRTVLREICIESPAAFKLACDKLLVGQAAIGDANGQANGEASTKRKRDEPLQRYEICEQCETEYDVLDNHEDACIWHPGKSILRLSFLSAIKLMLGRRRNGAGLGRGLLG
jgi:hypothetical protein